MTWSRAICIAVAGIGCALLVLALEALRFVGIPQTAWDGIPEYLRFRWGWGVVWVLVASGVTLLIAMLIFRWGERRPVYAAAAYLFLSGVASVAALALWVNAVETQVQPNLPGGYVSLSIGLLSPIVALASLAGLVVSAAVARTRSRRRWPHARELD